MKNIEKKIIWAVVFGLVIFAGITTFGDFQTIKTELVNFNWWVLVPVLGLSVINYAIRFFRWEMLLSSLKINLPKKDSLLIFLSGFVMSVTPGKFGEVFKSYLLKKRDGIEVARTMPIVISERITDLFALLVIISLGLFAFDYGKVIIAITWVVLGGIVLIITQERMIRPVIGLLKKVKILHKIAVFVEKTYDSTKIVLHPKMIIGGVLFGIFAWASEGLGLYIILRGLNTAIAIPTALFVYSFSTLVGAIAMLPGGIGATEGSMAGLLVMLEKVSKNIAIISTILIRMATLWFGVLVGLLALSIFTKKTDINVEDINLKK